MEEFNKKIEKINQIRENSTNKDIYDKLKNPILELIDLFFNKTLNKLNYERFLQKLGFQIQRLDTGTYRRPGYLV